MTVPASDVQSLFSARSGSGDLLQAQKLEDGMGLCLSGGGYRAMIYHVGALLRLNEFGLLPRLTEISSVSGGSITAGMLALRWSVLDFRDDGVAPNFLEQVAVPLMDFARVSIDVRAILRGFFPGSTAADCVAKSYDKHLFRGANLQDLSDTPRFTFMATNLQTGSGWRFSKCYAADSRVGMINNPDLPLSRVVAASSAFPPFLSPVRISFADGDVMFTEGADLHRLPFTTTAVLTDGGVYDNLGLERVWKRCRTILVSNGGQFVPEIGSPAGNWFGQTLRTLNLIQQQAENSRRRLLFGMSNAGQRNVVYWTIETPIPAYAVAGSAEIDASASALATDIDTRLRRLSHDEIKLLITVGYAGADASLRARCLIDNPPPLNLGAIDALMLGFA